MYASISDEILSITVEYKQLEINSYIQYVRSAGLPLSASFTMII